MSPYAYAGRLYGEIVTFGSVAVVIKTLTNDLFVASLDDLDDVIQNVLMFVDYSFSPVAIRFRPVFSRIHDVIAGKPRHMAECVELLDTVVI